MLISDCEVNVQIIVYQYVSAVFPLLPYRNVIFKFLFRKNKYTVKY